MITDPVTKIKYRVIDIHQHLSVDDSEEAVNERLDILREAGIDQAILLPPSGAFGRHESGCAEINRQTATVIASHPDQFLCGVAAVRLSDGESA
jgi:predicted TIM-barrel fold metal-dependent hydrolase